MDRVVELDLPWHADPGAPEPVVLQGSSSAVVVANASVSSGHEGECIVLSFDGCLVSRFGYPGDEALPGHPLVERGLGHDGIFEVLDPTWLVTLQRRNRVAFPSGDWPSGALHHFVVTFHDSTFECLAEGLEGGFSSDARPDLLAALARQVI